VYFKRNAYHTTAFPSIGIDTLLKWGTINGAEFLGIDDEKGTIEAGKTPGLNLITGMDGFKLTPIPKLKSWFNN
jgi:cytosine/adenosine deaminase-related metal-dependent hydrolase